jgi:VWFA-related protein
MAAVVWAGGRKTGALGPTRMVKLNVEVEDRRGRPVSGLTASEFRIFDQGREQKIVRFRNEEGRRDGLRPRAGAGEVSNRSGDAPPHVTLILFDLLNTNMDDQGFARGRILGALKKLAPAEYVYFYLLTLRGVIPLEGMAEPGEESSKPDAGWTREIQPRPDAAMKGVERLGPQNDNLFPWDRASMTYEAIEGLLGRLGAVAGRKNLVWITHGVPVEIGEQHPEWGKPVDYRPMLRGLSAALGSPFDATEIAVAGKAEAVDGEGKFRVRLRAGVEDLTLLPVGERYVGGLAVTYVEYRTGGRPKAIDGLRERLDLSSGQREELMSEGIRLSSELSFDADVSKLRVILFDDYSGAVDSITFTGLRKGQK